MHNHVFRKTGRWWRCLPAICLILLAACGSARETAPEAEASPTAATPALSLGSPVEAIEIAMPAEPGDRDGMFDAPPDMVIDPSRIYYAVLDTDPGPITVQLFAGRAPQTVNNFVYLALTGYYDGTTFHRVIEDFMAQGGDPTGTGMGGPGYRFADEFVSDLNFDRPGLLAMANSGPNTNGSQFFLTFGPTPHLDQRHAILGEVVDGMEALQAVALRDPARASTPGERLHRVSIYVSDESHLPTPEPTPLPTSTPTPYAPHQMTPENGGRPLADMDPIDRGGLFNTPPDMVIDVDRTYTATLKTDKGDMVFTLLPEAAPLGVNNFVVLANLGFFDGVALIRDGNGRASFFGLLDGTTAGLVGYSLPAEFGYQGDAVGPGLLAYVPDWNHPDQVLGGILYISRVAWDAATLERIALIGLQSEGQDVLDQLHGAGDEGDEDYEDATIESIVIAVAE